VFTNYWNFAGTNLPSGWTGSGYTINNGISIPYSSYSNNQGSYTNPNDILEMYGDIPIGTTTDNACAGYIGSSSAIAGGAPAVCFDINTGVISNGDVFGITSPGSGYSYTTAITTTTNIYGITWQSSSSTYFYVNYGKISQITTEIPTTSLPIGFSNTQGSQTTIGPFYWVRTRTTPPNGVMPTFQLSGVNTETSGQNTATIYLNFLPNNSPVTSGYTGYAPQLYCTSGCFQTNYAQYDNGGSVFNFYDNFAGTTLNTNFWVPQSGSTPVVNNGLDGITDGASPVSILSKFTYDPQTEILDLNANVIGFAGNLFHGFGIYYPNYGIIESWIADLGSNPYYYYLDNYNGNSGNSIDFSTSYPSLSPSTSYVFSNWEGTSASYATVNYGPILSNPNDFYGLSSANIGLKQFSTSYNLNIQWIRLRNLPPNGVMPSSSFGGVV
jgi:hypothetical protein